MNAADRIDPSKIRSFIRRQGRATAGQKLAIENHWQKYCLSPQQDADFSDIYQRSAPLIVEIGFGNGDSLANMAACNPEINYLGIEVHRPGVGHLLMLIEQLNLSNIRIYHHDAIEILEQKIPDQSLDGVHLFFPDPWQKRRHHKRRIVRPGFLALLNKKLVTGGYFHAATDWGEYAKYMLEIFTAEPSFINTSPNNGYCARPDYRPLTKFENRGLKMGHGVWDLIFRKK
jgi:tRNA (guanine-N7-)-methyltransferase